MKTRLLFLTLFLLTAFSFNTTAQNAGDNDPTFNPVDQGFGFGGGSSSSVSAPYGTIKTTSIQSDGKIIIGGGIYEYNGTSRNGIVRLNNNGSIDSSFVYGGGAYDVLTTSIQSDGKIIIGGDFGTYNGTTRKNIARLNADGSIDASFVVGGGANLDVLSTAIQSDGKIIIGGWFPHYSGTLCNHIARLNNNGSLDTTFVMGSGTNSAVETIAIQSDGKIIIGGQFTSYNGTAINRIARLNTDGSLDTTFTIGIGPDHYVYTITPQPDGKIIIAGNFDSYNGTAISKIARLNADGSLDNSFVGGAGTSGSIRTTAIKFDGKVIIGGNFYSYNGTPINRIARLNIDGSLDTTFDVGTGANGSVLTTAIQSDGKIIFGGDFTSYNDIEMFRIARANDDGFLDTTFNLVTGANDVVYTTATQEDGKIIVGGNFTYYNGVQKNRIARLNTDGSIDTSFVVGTGVDQYVQTIAIQSDGKIIIAGGFNFYNGTPIKYIVRLNTDGSLDTSFDLGTGVNYGVRTIAIQSDGKIIIGGYFTTYNGIGRNRIARLNLDGSLDTSFDIGAGADASVITTTLQPDGKIIVGGDFTNYNGTPRNRIARLNTDGSLDSSFDVGTGANSTILTTAIQNDGKIIIGGVFTYYNDTIKNYIARLLTSGSLDTSFLGTADNHVYTSAMQSDGKIIIGGNFSSYNGYPRNGIARINSNSSLDESFVVGTGANSSVYTTAIQPDNKIIIGGYFTSYNGIGRNRIARILQCTTNNSTDTIDECNSFTWIDGNTYTSSTTTPSFHVFNSEGCDSAITLNLTINATSSTDTVVACDSITWIDGNTYTTSTNTPTFILTNSVGCDSIITLNLIINSTSSIDSIVVCDSITWLDGNTYTTSTNTPTFILTNAVGCDSVITLNLTINSNSGTDTVTACDSITWIDGNTYTSSTNTPTFTLTNAAGCDSIVTLNLTINNSTSSIDMVTACDSITWIDGNNYTSSTNIPTFTLTNAAGCDSVVTLDLTINNSTFGTDIITACDSATWIDGNTYNASTNIPTFTLTNVAGCDSIITLNLTINNTANGTDIITACDSITWIDGNTYTSSTTTPTYTVVGGSVAGCDSIVTLTLTISPIDISVVQNPFTIVAMESGATYQWLDCNNSNAIISGETNQTYIPASSGNYAVVVSKNGCVDTSACVNFCNIDANYMFIDNGNGNYTFTNATSGNYTQSHWAFGDGTTSTATNPNHTFTVNNTFAVVLTVNDSTTVSSCMGYFIDVVNVTGVVSPLQCAAGFTMYADTNNINIILNATGTNLTYLWDFGDGNTSNAQFPTHTYATTDNYYLCLTIDDGAGCVDMYCDSIGENGVVFNKQTGFTINVIAPPLVTQVGEQEELSTSMSIYPNPTGSVLNVVFKQNERYQLQITAIDGKIIDVKTINGNTTVDVSKYSSGMYFITATNNEGKVYQSKFVKE